MTSLVLKARSPFSQILKSGRLNPWGLTTRKTNYSAGHVFSFCERLLAADRVHDKCSSVSGRLYILAAPAAGFANPDPSHYTGTACFGSLDKIQRQPSHRDWWLALGAFRYKSWG